MGFHACQPSFLHDVVVGTTRVRGHLSHLTLGNSWSLEGNREDLDGLTGSVLPSSGNSVDLGVATIWHTIGQQEQSFNLGVTLGEGNSGSHVGATASSESVDEGDTSRLGGASDLDDSGLPLGSAAGESQDVVGLGWCQRLDGGDQGVLDVLHTGVVLGANFESDTHGSRSINKEVNSVNARESSENAGQWGVGLDL